MAKVIITPSLEEQINKKFKHQSIEILLLLKSLEENPYKGKEIGTSGKLVIKEIKYKNFRFYFITDGYKIKILRVSELKDLVIKFIRFSDKNDQQETIDKIKQILRNLGDEGF
jgi:hypothetical protein